MTARLMFFSRSVSQEKPWLPSDLMTSEGGRSGAFSRNIARVGAGGQPQEKRALGKPRVFMVSWPLGLGQQGQAGHQRLSSLCRFVGKPAWPWCGPW